MVSGKRKGKFNFYLAPLIVLFLIIAGSCNIIKAKEKDNINPEAKERTFYLDSHSGNDSNNGLTPATAWRTLSKSNTQVFSPGDKLFLFNGSVFYGKLEPKGGGR
jgi:hypothetical protein